MSDVNIFEYQDYREYLRDYYKEQKVQKKYFSYRYFSQKAGINSSAFLFYVIENKRNLTKKSLLKIANAIGLSRKEEEYFENLVFFNQAKTIAEKNHYYSKIVEIRNPVDIQTVGKDRYEYYSKWFHSVVREVVTFFEFNGDYEKLGNSLFPTITKQEAKDSVSLLEKLGFIEKDDQGHYYQTENLIEAKPSPKQIYEIEKFQKEMLQNAINAYENIPRKNRMSASTTFSISKETFDLFVMKTREFRKELMEMARLDVSPQNAVQFTFNLFPVSENPNGGKSNV